MLIWLKKGEYYKLKNVKIFFESIYKNGKSKYEFDDIKIRKQNFHQTKRPISIKKT